MRIFISDVPCKGKVKSHRHRCSLAVRRRRNNESTLPSVRAQLVQAGNDPLLSLSGMQDNRQVCGPKTIRESGGKTAICCSGGVCGGGNPGRSRRSPPLSEGEQMVDFIIRSPFCMAAAVVWVDAHRRIQLWIVFRQLHTLNRGLNIHSDGDHFRDPASRPDGSPRQDLFHSRQSRGEHAYRSDRKSSHFGPALQRAIPGSEYSENAFYPERPATCHGFDAADGGGCRLATITICLSIKSCGA